MLNQVFDTMEVEGPSRVGDSGRKLKILLKFFRQVQKKHKLELKKILKKIYSREFNMHDPGKEGATTF